ncbi:MAG: phosphoenolpyruvate--protein phosphotransferase [Planctomycetaceae bacterium]|nr:phosphoenolpyruvate--protein phosphotransferase [Planctomycetaceae bacterium]
MQTFQGIAVSPGVAIGEAIVVDNEGFRIPRRFVDPGTVDDELDRLRISVDSVAEDLERHRRDVSEQLGDEYGAIFSAQQQMLRDAKLQNEIEDLIRARHYSPEYSVSRTLRRFAKVFQNLENRFMAERAHDIVDIEKRLLSNLLGKQREELSHLTSPGIVLAHELTPGEAANLDPKFVLAFASEIGGPGGHTAIVAKALEIPAVVGTGSFLNEIASGDLLLIDGDHGQVILQPDDETIQRCNREAEQHRSMAAQLETLRDLPAETLDGQQIDLNANIEFPREVKSCSARGADGIGLYRTEFLYLGSGEPPSEEDHFQAYAQVVQSMQGHPIVIRTLDLGADKMGQTQEIEPERNPFLGLRSIRLSLRNLPLFRTQLRAILRASTLGDVRVMFPLISTVQELRQAKAELCAIMDDLSNAGIDFNARIPVGMMVEVPAAAMTIDRFVKESDFISIGTNDLIQYTLAVDRSNKDVAELYNASDPAILQLIYRVTQAAQQGSIPATLCGQMSASSIYTMLLLGLGLRSLSVPPSAIPEIKNVCRRVSIDQCEHVARQALQMETADEVTNYLKQELAKALPDLALN